MKIIVTHSSPDLDAITSVWLVKKFLSGWETAQIRFVPAGGRLDGGKWKNEEEESVIETIEGSEVIHVDTGLGPLDHHQTVSDKISGASLTWDYVKTHNLELNSASQNDKMKSRIEAVGRMVKVVVDIDHFKEVFRKDALADYHEFDLIAILDGLKLQFPGQDEYYVEFVSKSLDTILHQMENRLWAEREILKGQTFSTKYGKGIGLESINDTVIKLSQKMGFVVAIRKDPRKGYVRIKALPAHDDLDIDLTGVYEELKRLDTDATWFLHVSRKMLLNGSTKNPKMRPTKLSLSEIVAVMRKI